MLIAACSPWRNAYAERFIGSLRRECLDHVITLSERHLLRVARSYVDYYNRTRTYLALGKDPPAGRTVQGPEAGVIVAFLRSADCLTATNGARQRETLPE